MIAETDALRAPRGGIPLHALLTDSTVLSLGLPRGGATAVRAVPSGSATTTASTRSDRHEGAAATSLRFPLVSAVSLIHLLPHRPTLVAGPLL